MSDNTKEGRRETGTHAATGLMIGSYTSGIYVTRTIWESRDMYAGEKEAT